MGAPPLPARLSSPSGRCMRIGCTHKVIIHRPRLCSRLNVHAAAHSASQQAWETSPICPPISYEARRVVLGGRSSQPASEQAIRIRWEMTGRAARSFACLLLRPWPPCRWPSPRAPVVHCRGPLPRHRLTARRTQTPDEQVSRCAVPVWPRTESASRIYSTRCPSRLEANDGWVLAAVGA